MVMLLLAESYLPSSGHPSSGFLLKPVPDLARGVHPDIPEVEFHLLSWIGCLPRRQKEVRPEKTDTLRDIKTLFCRDLHEKEEHSPGIGIPLACLPGGEV